MQDVNTLNLWAVGSIIMQRSPELTRGIYKIGRFSKIIFKQIDHFYFIINICVPIYCDLNKARFDIPRALLQVYIFFFFSEYIVQHIQDQPNDNPAMSDDRDLIIRIVFSSILFFLPLLRIYNWISIHLYGYYVSFWFHWYCSSAVTFEHHVICFLQVQPIWFIIHSRSLLFHVISNTFFYVDRKHNIDTSVYYICNSILF